MKTAAPSQSLNYVGVIKQNAEKLAEMHAGHSTCFDLNHAQRILEVAADLEESIIVEQMQASRLLVAAEYVMQQLSATGFADSKAGKMLVEAIAAARLP